MWLSAAEALKRLGSKPQSLYANVSRGRIRARPDPDDARKSQYLADDVERLASRARGRRASAAIAAETVEWGEPLFTTSISTVANGRLIYRGRDAAELARTSTFEAVAELLLQTRLSQQWVDAGLSRGVGGLARELAARIPHARASLGMGGGWLRSEAAQLLRVAMAHLAGSGGGQVAKRLAEGWGCPEAETAISRALILLADHELNPSAFAARVTISTGAPLAAGLLAGVGALLGPRHGTAASFVSALADDIREASDAKTYVRDWLGEGRELPGFGHKLYPQGDIRAGVLINSFDLPAEYRALLQIGGELTGDAPNIDFAIAALSRAFGLPSDAPLTLFALARSAGWLAHMLEQLESGQMIRPRARYVGPLRWQETDAAE